MASNSGSLAKSEAENSNECSFTGDIKITTNELTDSDGMSSQKVMVEEKTDNSENINCEIGSKKAEMLENCNDSVTKNTETEVVKRIYEGDSKEENQLSELGNKYETERVKEIEQNDELEAQEAKVTALTDLKESEKAKLVEPCDSSSLDPTPLSVIDVNSPDRSDWTRLLKLLTIKV